MPNEEDHKIPEVRMDQTMAVAAVMVVATLSIFVREEDSPEEKTVTSLIALSIFLHQLLMMSKHKDKVVAILEAVIMELKDAIPSQSSI